MCLSAVRPLFRERSVETGVSVCREGAVQREAFSGNLKIQGFSY